MKAKTKRVYPAHVRLVFSREDSSGYKSGLSSERGTRETFSTANTRSAGMPARRHFCTAWYDTPSALAKALSPPAPLIARTTADSVMQQNVQPIVAFRQQRMRAFQLGSMQRMVVRTKKDAKEAFANALNKFLERREVPVRGRASWLYDRLKAHARQEVVSYESCRKWIKGLDIPDQGNLTILCEAIGATRDDLFPTKGTPTSGSLEALIKDLEPDEQQKVIGYISALREMRQRRAS